MDVPEERSIGPYQIVFATGFGVFLSALDSSIVNVSLWTMAEVLNVGMSEIQWVVIAYLLVLTSMMPLAGKLGDRYGKTRVFKYGILLFTLGSLGCAMSTTLEFLVAARVFQAFGASMMTATGLALITYFTTPGNRGRAIGLNSLILAAALGLGPVVGGILTELFGWESIFLVNLPVGLVGFLIVSAVIPSTERVVEVKFDVVGAILFFIALFCLVCSVSISIAIGREIFVITILIALAAFIGLFIQEGRFTSPIIPTALMIDRRISISLISALISFMAVVPVSFLLPFFFQEALKMTPIATGVFLAIQPIVFSVSGPLAGLISERVNARVQTVIGLIVQMTGLIMLGLSIPNIALMALSVVVIATGLSTFTVANGNFIMTSAPREYLGVVSALTNVSRTTGFSVATAMATTIFSTLFVIFNPGGIDSGPVFVESYIQATMFSIWFFAGLLLVSVVLTIFRGLSPVEIERSQKDHISHIDVSV